MKNLPFTYTKRIVPKKNPVSFEEMNKLKIQVGEVESAVFLQKARNPSYEIKLDINEEKSKTTCGQFVNNYTPQELYGKQVLGVTNFPPRRIAGVKSEVLTLGFSEEVGSHQAICLQPALPVEKGTFANFPDPNLFVEDVEFDAFLALEVRSGTIEGIKTVEDYTIALVDFGDTGQSISWIPGMLEDKETYIGKQVAVWLNPLPFRMADQTICESIVLVLPLEKYDHHTTALYQEVSPMQLPVTLVVASKKVIDGLELF